MKDGGLARAWTVLNAPPSRRSPAWYAGMWVFCFALATVIQKITDVFFGVHTSLELLIMDGIIFATVFIFVSRLRRT